MLKGRGEQKSVMKVSPELHRVVRFARVNLHAEAYPVVGPFDLIFCRNVLIYFDQNSKEKVIAGILRALSQADTHSRAGQAELVPPEIAAQLAVRDEGSDWVLTGAI